MTEMQLTRRNVIQGSGALVVGFALGSRTPASAQAGGPAAKSVAPDEVDGFLAIGADGQVTVFSGKVDLGTGVRTALPQMAAEEMDVPLERVTVVQGDTALTPDQGPTYGSLSIQNGGVQIRQAAATARRRLIELAAQRLNAAPDGLTTADGTVRPKAGGRSIPYGELVAGGAFALKVDKEATTKDPAAFTIVGRPVRRLDIPDK